MPEISYGNRKIYCEHGANLRKVLIDNGIYPHNGQSRYINCMGSGSCGTCAVKIIGKIPPLNEKEKSRLAVPPHRLSNGLRLSCQIKVENDLRVIKYGGFWGHEIPEEKA